MLNLSPFGVRQWGRRRSPSLTSSVLRNYIDQEFLYRGTSSLEIRQLRVGDGRAEIHFYARPVFSGDSRLGSRRREALFAEQLFADVITILRKVQGSFPEVNSVRVNAWVRPIDATGGEILLLSTSSGRGEAGMLERSGRLGPYEILRRLPTRARIDREGRFSAEGDFG